MHPWNDTLIRRHVNDVIETSYLMTLGEHDLRRHVKRFIDACDTVLHNNIAINGDVRIIRVKVTLLGLRLMLIDGRMRSAVDDAVPGIDTAFVSEVFIDRYIDMKRSLMTFCNEVHPKLSQAIIDECTRRDTADDAASRKRKRRPVKTALLVAGALIVTAGGIAYLLKSLHST